MEYYIANTSDLLLNRSIPLMTGYTQILTNVGKTQNKGLEITLSTTNIQTEDFTWKTDFTFSTNRSKIVELADGKVDDLPMVGLLANLWMRFGHISTIVCGRILLRTEECWLL